MGEPTDSLLAVERTNLAAERTELAKQRTLLAEQRTFSAWLRTGLATIAVGLGAEQLLGNVEPGWTITTIAAVLSLTGITIFAVALWSYRLTMESLVNEEARGIPIGVVGAITAILTVCAIAAFIVIVAN